MTDSADNRSGRAAAEPQVGAQQLVKMLIEIGPLLVFFAVNGITKNLFHATAAFMVATALALAISYRQFGKVPPMLMVSGVLVLVLGGLTLWLQEAVFIKIKPTIVYMLFATVLGAGLLFDKYYLRILMGEVFNLTDRGWKLLTIRWAAFFVFLAFLNEIVWRNFSVDFWISFKLLGAIPLTLLFGFAQLGLLKRHAASQADNA